MSDFKAVQNVMRNSWQTKRLRFRALEDNETDRAFYHESISQDPSSFPLTHHEVSRPQSRSLSNSNFDQVRKMMLSVIICLPDEEASIPQSSTGSKNSASSQDTQTATKDAGARAKGTSIGLLGLAAAPPEQHHHRNTWLAIFIIDGYQGKGYGPEAVNWALDWAFRSAGMHRVTLGCFGYNIRAQRLYEKMGFVKEGVLREKIWFDRAWYDEIFYGMLEAEWEKLRS